MLTREQVKKSLIKDANKKMVGVVDLDLDEKYLSDDDFSREINRVKNKYEIQLNKEVCKLSDKIFEMLDPIQKENHELKKSNESLIKKNVALELIASNKKNMSDKQFNKYMKKRMKKLKKLSEKK